MATEQTPIETMYQRLHVHVMTIVILFTVIACSANHQAVANSGRAVIFSPGEYQHLPRAPHHQLAAKGLARQLKRIHFAGDEGEIISLTGALATKQALIETIEEMILTVDSGDTLVVAVFSYGFQLGQQSHLATYATHSNSTSDLTETITVGDLLELMSDVADTRQLLLVDGYGGAEMINSDSTVAENSVAESLASFGRNTPRPAANQLLSLSRGQKLVDRQGNRISSYAWSLLDGLGGHADTNQDGKTSSLELTQYMTLFAEDNGTGAPRLAGKISDSADLFDVEPISETFYASEFNTQARELFIEGTQALFLELDSEAAINLFDRARRLVRDESLRLEIESALLTARVLMKGGKPVLTDDLSPTPSWKLIANGKLNITKPGGRTIAGTLTTGMIAKVTSRTGEWLYVESATVPKITAGKMTFEVVPMSPGFVQVTQFLPANTQIVPNEYLQDQLTTLRHSSP